MPTPKMSKAKLKAAVDATLKEGSVSAAARALGVPRGTMQNRLRKAEAEGLTMAPRAEPNPSRWRPGAEIVQARKAEYERLRTAGDGRTIRTIHMADDKPYAVFFLGDPHLDNPGTDLALWERWINPLNYRRHIHGFGLGDWLDNWLRVLGHLYSTAETTAPEGWILLEHYLDQIGEHLIASVAGNHDDWSGHSDVLGMLMAKHDVVHRSKSLRVALVGPNGRRITIGSRHRWTGNSMWNEVHAIKKAARLGQRDNILVGGDKHISGDGREKDPDTGRITHCFQVSAFKLIDDYADDKGFLDRHVSPAIAAVIDPSRPDADPELVKHFYEPEAAVDYLSHLRRRK
jgi:transposase-like protein